MDTHLSEEVCLQVRKVLEDFYERVFQDRMIGYLFQGRDQKRLVEKEYEFTLQNLGVNLPYTGRPMDKVHFPLKIFGGHFDRRQTILKETLSDHHFPSLLAQRWLDHTASLRAQITSPGRGDCIP